MANENSRIERQHLLHLQRSVSQEHPRGSVEETKKILQEIERINLELGYKRRVTVAFPRVASGEGYFYPRQQFRPEFLTKPRDNFNRMNNRRAIYPFNNQNYYYPTPYLQVPINARSLAFKANSYPVLYAPVNSLPYGNFKDVDAADGSIRLGTIVVLPAEEREAKSVSEVTNEKKAGKNKEKPVKDESSIIDDIVNYVPDALGFSDDDEDERQETVPVPMRLPTIKNDKFLNLAVKKHPQEEEDDRKLTLLTPSAKNNVNRAFNFSNPIEKLQSLKNFTNPIEKLQNLTSRFSINYGSNSNQAKEVEIETSTPSAEDLEELAEDKLDDKEDEKSPFGFAFGPQQQLQTYKEGGLIIQRLKVRRGGIAIGKLNYLSQTEKKLRISYLF